MSARGLLRQLADKGHRVPIGTHLILNEHPGHDAILLDGKRLGDVVTETADRFGTPLALPLMDLKIEKEALLSAMDIPAGDIEAFHFDDTPRDPGPIPPTERMEATCAALEEVTTAGTLLPIGMCIGPFSLMTKLVKDPITPVYMAGQGIMADEDEDVEMIERCIEITQRLVLDYIRMQVRAGAQAVIVCEPAANQVYFSPNQLSESFTVFDHFVMDGLHRIRALLEDLDADLILHDCGELTSGMISRFATLDLAMLSLGGSCVLWRDAAHLPKSTVLYGNLPSKRFYSTELTASQIDHMAGELVSKMRNADHPFILGTECDVLSVPGKEDEIMAKVLAFLNHGK
jgi:uroporphyrinogen-III decarboxylase